MSCIPTFSSSPALAANASASAEVAAKAWRRVTGVFIVRFLCATMSQSTLVEARRFRAGGIPNTEQQRIATGTVGQCLRCGQNAKISQ
jgi:hypothetical protein